MTSSGSVDIRRASGKCWRTYPISGLRCRCKSTSIAARFPATAFAIRVESSLFGAIAEHLPSGHKEKTRKRISGVAHGSSKILAIERRMENKRLSVRFECRNRQYYGKESRDSASAKYPKNRGSAERQVAGCK